MVTTNKFYTTSIQWAISQLSNFGRQQKIARIYLRVYVLHLQRRRLEKEREPLSIRCNNFGSNHNRLNLKKNIKSPMDLFFKSSLYLVRYLECSAGWLIKLSSLPAILLEHSFPLMKYPHQFWIKMSSSKSSYMGEHLLFRPGCSIRTI